MATSAATPSRIARTLVAIAAGRSHSSFQTSVRRFMATSVCRGFGIAALAGCRLARRLAGLIVLAVGVVAAVAGLVQGDGQLLLRGCWAEFSDQHARRSEENGRRAFGRDIASNWRTNSASAGSLA